MTVLCAGFGLGLNLAVLDPDPGIKRSEEIDEKCKKFCAPQCSGSMTF
jgi:hypothetical protein